MTEDSQSMAEVSDGETSTGIERPRKRARITEPTKKPLRRKRSQKYEDTLGKFVQEQNSSRRESAKLDIKYQLSLPGRLLDGNVRVSPEEPAEAKDKNKPGVGDTTRLVSEDKSYDERDVGRAVETIGPDKVKKTERGWLIDGMKTALMAHQLIAVAWAVSREKGRAEPHGGLIADGMGLGKTLEALGIIVANPPPQGKRTPQSTLIITPGGLSKQWMGEVEKHLAQSQENSDTEEETTVDDKRDGSLDASNESTDLDKSSAIKSSNKRCFSPILYRDNRLPRSAMTPNTQRGTKAQIKGQEKIYKKILEEASIVLATFEELRSDFPNMAEQSRWRAEIMSRLEEENEEIIEEAIQAEINDRINKNLGQIFGARFHRVILDESAVIKNETSMAFSIVSRITAKTRWCLSGTPVTNSAAELSPYLRFLRCANQVEENEFRKTYKVDAEDAKARVKHIMSMITMRRGHSSTYCDRPLVTLPDFHEETITFNYSEEELRTNRKLDEVIGAFMEQNQSKPKEERDKNINFCLVLRQMAAHPFLLESIIEKIFTKDNIKELQEELGSHGGQIPVYQQIGLCAAEDTTVDDPEITALDKSEPIFGQSAFGGKFVMSLQRLGNRIEGVRPCGICEQGVEKPFKLIPCLHIFCFKCVVEKISREDPTNSADTCCPVCHTPHRGLRQAEIEQEPPGDIVDGEDGADGGMEKVLEKEGEKKIPKRRAPVVKRYRASGLRRVPLPGDDLLGNQPIGSGDPSSFLGFKMAAEDLTPSSKLTALKSVLLRWGKEAPDDKIILFTEFITTGRLLGRIAEGEGIGFLYYFGEFTMKKKAQILEEFRMNKEAKILIAGFKCGNAGLNLTCANRVILVDLWWNTAMEKQAFHRVHRIGQKKETYLVRIVARGSVDEQILKIQEAKDLNISKMMDLAGEVLGKSKGE